MGITLENDDQVRLQLLQYADDVYDLDSQNEEDSPPATALPDPRVVPDIVLFEAAGETVTGSDAIRYRYRIGWATDNEKINMSHFAVRWRATGETKWNSTDVPYIGNGLGGAQLHQFDLYVLPVTAHEIELEAVNKLGVRGTTFASSLTPIASLGTVVAPSYVHVASTTTGIIIKWTSAPPTARMKIYIATASNNFADASLLVTSGGQSHEVGLAINQTAYFWLLPVNYSGANGPLIPPLDDSGYYGISGLQTYASDTAAGAAGLTTGDQYKNSLGVVRVKS